MEWFRTMSKVWRDRKLRGLEPTAFKLAVCSWGMAMEHETGGHLSDDDVETLLASIGLRARKAAAAIAVLEDAELWERNGAGWVIHDWEEHQGEAIRIQADRDRRREQERLKKKRQRAAAKGDSE